MATRGAPKNNAVVTTRVDEERTGPGVAPSQVLYFAGLGLLALFELVEWPVALAIGAGTLVAGRAARRGAVRRDEPVPE
ncbi:hypothetical protein [Saccharothrix syringae]|uniref:Uncharacterized protein n=1 Tax=Saccharothrix syringae TaxID=103733 RepID=A0A5Q0H654_SACSY|nr:hypothetical protein [Saccharothrix syringae]QFZ21701.1 hypothetical protein EKG83_33725 [Saccharothrix syringae]